MLKDYYMNFLNMICGVIFKTLIIQMKHVDIKFAFDYFEKLVGVGLEHRAFAY